MMGNRAGAMEGRSTKQCLTIVLMLSASYRHVTIQVESARCLDTEVHE